MDLFFALPISAALGFKFFSNVALRDKSFPIPGAAYCDFNNHIFSWHHVARFIVYNISGKNVDDQVWYKNVTRSKAMEEIEQEKQVLM